VAHRARLYHHAPYIEAQANRDRRAPAAAETRGLRPWFDRKLLPRCPAFLAARETSPTKVCGRLARHLPWWIPLRLCTTINELEKS
jgi:hypothetical protein